LLPVLIQALVLASTGLLSAGSITLVILLLISERSWHNGLGYALGYTIAYTVIGVSAVVLGYRATGNYSRVVTPRIFKPSSVKPRSKRTIINKICCRRI
jgi:hypothetical protein